MILFLLLLISLVLLFLLFPKRNSPLSDLNNTIQTLVPEFKGSIAISTEDFSYTVNKEKVFLKLVSQKNIPLSQKSILYIALHEVSHCLVEEIGHGQQFQQKFAELISRALSKGYFNDLNFTEFD